MWWQMGSKEDKFIYHITSIKNLEGIIENGLQSRKNIGENCIAFDDHANSDIIEKRRASENIPFHLTPYNIFSYQYRLHYQDWVYILIEKKDLKKYNHVVIRKHPLNSDSQKYNSFEEANEYIDWDKVKVPFCRWYDIEHTIDISQEKMSEVQIKDALQINKIKRIIVGNDETKYHVEKMLKSNNLNIAVYTVDRLQIKNTQDHFYEDKRINNYT